MHNAQLWKKAAFEPNSRVFEKLSACQPPVNCRAAVAGWLSACGWERAPPASSGCRGAPTHTSSVPCRSFDALGSALPSSSPVQGSFPSVGVGTWQVAGAAARALLAGVADGFGEPHRCQLLRGGTVGSFQPPPCCPSLVLCLLLPSFRAGGAAPQLVILAPNLFLVAVLWWYFCQASGTSWRLQNHGHQRERACFHQHPPDT